MISTACHGHFQHLVGLPFGWIAQDLIQNLSSRNDTSEDRMSSIKIRVIETVVGVEREEELRSTGVPSSVRHRQDTWKVGSVI